MKPMAYEGYFIDARSPGAHHCSLDLVVPLTIALGWFVDLTLTFSANGGAHGNFPAGPSCHFKLRAVPQHLPISPSLRNAFVGLTSGHVFKPGLRAERRADSLEGFHPVSMLCRKRANLHAATSHGALGT